MAGVVVVLSTPRAGSTWLSKVLRAHPGLDVHGQLTNDNHKLYLATPLRALNPFGDDYVEFDLRRSGLSRALRTRLLHALYRSNGAGRTVVLATPSTSVFVPLFLDAFPAARYVHLHRNPLDVVASFRGFMAKNAEGFAQRFRTRRRHGTVEGARSVAVHGFHTLRWNRLPYPGYLATRPRGFQRASRLPELDFLCWYYAEYEREIAAALAHVPEGWAHEVRYEDLVGDFEPTVRGLLGFVGLEAPAGYLEETGETVKRESVGRFRTSFTEEELDEVRRGLARYGVEADVGGAR